MISLGRIVTQQALALADAAGRLVEQGDTLIREQIGRGLGGLELRHLAATVQQQHALVAGLGGNAITAVRLATRHLAPALERARAAADPSDRSHDDEQAADRLLRSLRELEHAIHQAERHLHGAGTSIARIADRAERHDAAAVCASLIARLVRPGPT